MPAIDSIWAIMLSLRHQHLLTQPVMAKIIANVGEDMNGSWHPWQLYFTHPFMNEGLAITSLSPKMSDSGKFVISSDR